MAEIVKKEFEEPSHREPQSPDRRKTLLDRRTGVDRRVQARDESGYDGPERRVAERAAHRRALSVAAAQAADDPTTVKPPRRAK